MPGPPPKPNALRRNRDTFTGERKARCYGCGTLKRESAACAACGMEGSSPTAAPPVSGPRSAAPELPTPRAWLKPTREWWDAWTRSAQTAVFEPSEWETLKMLLPIVDSMYREENPIRYAKLFDAVHKAERGLGGTHMERLRARIDTREVGPAGGVGQQGQGPDADDVVVLADYRAMFDAD